MKFKNLFLVEKQNYNGIEITSKALKQSIESIEAVPVVSVYDEKRKGNAYNFKVKKGVLYCDADMNIMPDNKISIVPEFKLYANQDGIQEIILTRCLLTFTPMDVRNIIWRSSQ